MIRVVLSRAAITLMILGCGSRDDPPKTNTAIAARPPAPIQSVSPLIDTVTVPPRLPCFRPDSSPLRYGEITTSSADGDASGVAYTFEVTPAGMVGAVVDAR